MRINKMDLPKKYKNLIKTLINDTENNQLKWYEGDTNDQFYVNLKGGIAVLDKYAMDSDIYYGFKFINTTGEEVNSYKFHKKDYNDNLSTSCNFTDLQKLYNLIEKKYSKIEAIIDSMINEIVS